MNAPTKTENYRAIDISQYDVKFEGEFDPGPAPTLLWVKIEDLIIDARYQRDIGTAGKRNVTKIAQEFDWSKFGTVIIAPVGGNKYAIVDGQHRTTAAALRGIEEIPCQLVMASPHKQAEAFVAINGTLTRVTPMQLHHALVAAGDKDACDLDAAVAKAGVSICRYPVANNQMKAGQTMAASMLYRMLVNYGEDILVLGLKCITKTGDGNPSWVRASIIEAICMVLSDRRDFRDEAKLIATFQKFKFAREFEESLVYGRKSKIRHSLALKGSIIDFLLDNYPK